MYYAKKNLLNSYNLIKIKIFSFKFKKEGINEVEIDILKKTVFFSPSLIVFWSD